MAERLSRRPHTAKRSRARYLEDAQAGIDETPWPQCSAARADGHRCRGRRVHGRWVCQRHGGRVPAGIESHAWKHGLFSQYLPQRLTHVYNQALEQGASLLPLRQHIALMDTRVIELLGQLDAGETSARWHELLVLIEQCQRAHSVGDVTRMHALLLQQHHLVQRGAADAESWQELYHALETRRRLTETEYKRQMAVDMMLTAEEAIGIIDMLATLVAVTLEEYVANADIRTQINARLAHELTELLTTQSPADAAPGYALRPAP